MITLQLVEPVALYPWAYLPWEVRAGTGGVCGECNAALQWLVDNKRIAMFDIIKVDHLREMLLGIEPCVVFRFHLRAQLIAHDVVVVEATLQVHEPTNADHIMGQQSLMDPIGTAYVARLAKQGGGSP